MKKYVCLIALFVNIAFAQAEECTSQYRGQTLTQAQVDVIIAQEIPVNLCGTVVSGLDFSGAKLSGANFAGADLKEARFDDADLSGAMLANAYFRWGSLQAADLSDAILTNAILADANLHAINLRRANLSNASLRNSDLANGQLFYTNLSHTDLHGANLRNSNLSWANLHHADLTEAWLRSADLAQADLSYVNFTDADLSQTNLQQANLSHAKLLMTDLTNADFSQANLDHTFYQPILDGMPNVVTFATANHIRTMQFDPQWGIPALVQLRSAYSQNGMRKMEREITAMVKTKEMEQHWLRGGWGYVEAGLSYLLFYLPSDYGARPGRPLRIFMIGILFFSLFYWLALRYPSKHNHLLLLWEPKYSAHSQQAHPHRTQRQTQRFIQLVKARETENFYMMIRENLRLLRIALYVSLLMSFQIGWRELNVSSWLGRLQKRNYFFKPIGWIRVIAGTQSLLSAYLIVLWAFTYFSRPFEW